MVVVLLTKLCQVNALAIFSRIVVALLPLGLGPAEYLLLLSHSFVGARENLKKKKKNVVRRIMRAAAGTKKLLVYLDSSCGAGFLLLLLCASSIFSRFVSSSQRTAPEVKRE